MDGGGTVEKAVLRVLAGIAAPGGAGTLADPPLLDGIAARNGMVQVALAAGRERAVAFEPVRVEAERQIRAIPGVLNAAVVLTAHRTATGAAGSRPAAAPAPAAPRPPPQGGGGHRPLPLGGGEARAPAAGPLLAEVRAVIAVASGKGGVGKSTTAVNLAVSLARSGLSVGLLDADIHGPSLPRMMGLRQRAEAVNGRLPPFQRWGIRVMSMGSLVDERAALIWRGPMVMGALNQLMADVDWGPLDVLLVDMPPGTGDAQLTLAQKAAPAGAVIVSTPQDIALIDARRGVTMFGKTNVPVLGIVENMSTFCCPNCGHETALFGHGGARKEADALGVPFLGEVPLLLEIREGSDGGEPVTVSDPDGAASRAYAAIAGRIREAIAHRLR
ncbi:MAG: Mrp/NBP35 family ATP-binding protein [Gluconacetobacter diazotrophicus]|nr:Mrp/NBP35 family ATP-binding protein [Gluconacetobacter diazotrophicus]